MPPVAYDPSTYVYLSTFNIPYQVVVVWREVVANFITNDVQSAKGCILGYQMRMTSGHNECHRKGEEGDVPKIDAAIKPKDRPRQQCHTWG